jgi:predicted ATPase
MKDKIVLNKIHINNFLSLHDVELPIKSLTILVGPNASGKSNILKALKLLKEMVLEGPPTIGEAQSMFWAGVANSINFQLQAHLGKKLISYKLDLRIARSKSQFYFEELIVDGIKVISAEKGKGEIRDEDNKNPIPYRSTKLALGSAGAYGRKPVTNALANFIREWEFDDFNPYVRHASMRDITLLRKMVSPLDSVSDETLPLIAYYVLLNQPEVPSLIAIEEPEWNLHPDLFIELGRLLKKLSQRTQVIIITYSSQLLDIFNAEDLADSLGILLLHNEPGEGTRVINLEKVQQDREAVKDWMEEFGLGSAIFESQLLGETVLVQHFGKSLARYNS